MPEKSGKYMGNMGNIATSAKKSVFKQVIAATTAFALILSQVSAAVALPTGGTVASGKATIATTGSTMNINQTTNSATINWSNFSSATGETINFNDPNSKAVTFNKVTTPNVPSVLAGALNSNGHVVIINSAGITFTKDSQVNVGALTASTANDFNVDAQGLQHFSNLSDAAIINNGSIKTAKGGLALLHAQHVVNNGTISTPMGQTVLTATDGLTVDMTGDVKITYQPSSTPLSQSIVENTGTITADGGKVVINNQQANDIASSVINLSGTIDTSCISCTTANGGSVQIASLGDINVGEDFEFVSHTRVIAI